MGRTVEEKDRVFQGGGLFAGRVQTQLFNNHPKQRPRRGRNRSCRRAKAEAPYGCISFLLYRPNRRQHLPTAEMCRAAAQRDGVLLVVGVARGTMRQPPGPHTRRRRPSLRTLPGVGTCLSCGWVCVLLSCLSCLSLFDPQCNVFETLLHIVSQSPEPGRTCALGRRTHGFRR